jgi:DNA repair protein RadC
MSNDASPETLNSSDQSENDIKDRIQPAHQGHRSRLLERFLNSGLKALHQHEIIELLLTFAIPRRDTKPIARILLAKYKTVSALLNAPVDELKEIDGIGERSASLFPFIKDLMAYCLKEKYENQSLISHRKDVEEYLRFHFGFRKDEYVASIFLDNANHVLQTDIIAEGTVNQCAVYPRTIIDKALRCGAASIILAHNHPGGGLNPSEADWVITERILTVGKLLDIPLLDHIIISRHKVVSLREMPRWPRA